MMSASGQTASEADGLLDPANAQRPQKSDSSESATASFARRCASDRDAIQFGVRMSVCLTVSSIFVLARVPIDDDGDGGADEEGRGRTASFPEGMWVLITVLFVCWFPTLDAASVLEKSAQRLAGTAAGAVLGLACGFLSLSIDNARGELAQAIFLAASIAIVSFAVCAAAAHARVDRSGAKFVERKGYATILCLLTFMICLVPFYSSGDDERGWHKSLVRVMNVIIGCALGVVLSMAVFPRPTVTILQEKVSRQIELAGEASEAVLHTAADIFSEETYVPLALAEEILRGDRASTTAPGQRGSVRIRTPFIYRKWRTASDDGTSSSFDYGHDVVLEKYEAATKEWRAAKAHLGVLKYDPFNIGRPNDLLECLRREVAQTLARAMRIQTTVVLIDGIVRNDPKHRFSREDLDLLANVGALIRRMLMVPLDAAVSDAAASELGRDMAALRRMIVDLAATVSETPETQMPSLVVGQHGADGGINKSSLDLANLYGGDDATETPKYVHGSHVCSLLFLQLVEHLALRSVRLYRSWRQYDKVCRKAEDLRASFATA